jgi:hypothetical protein
MYTQYTQYIRGLCQSRPCTRTGEYSLPYVAQGTAALTVISLTVAICRFRNRSGYVEKLQEGWSWDPMRRGKERNPVQPMEGMDKTALLWGTLACFQGGKWSNERERTFPGTQCSREERGNLWTWTLKMEAAYSSVTPIPDHKITWYHNPEDHNLKNHRREILKAYNAMILPSNAV